MGSGKKKPSRSQRDRSVVFKNAVHISQHRPLAILHLRSIFWLYSVDSDVLLVFHWLPSPGWFMFIPPLPLLEMDFFSIIRVGVYFLHVV